MWVTTQLDWTGTGGLIIRSLPSLSSLTQGTLSKRHSQLIIWKSCQCKNMQNFKNMLKQVEKDISFCLTEYTFEIIVFLLQNKWVGARVAQRLDLVWVLEVEAWLGLILCSWASYSLYLFPYQKETMFPSRGSCGRLSVKCFRIHCWKALSEFKAPVLRKVYHFYKPVNPSHGCKVILSSFILNIG